MNEWLALTEALSRTMRAHAPDWTDRSDADPGITMLEMLAFLAESLRFHRGVVAGGSPTASRIIAALSAYDEPDSIAVRVNGKLSMKLEAWMTAHEHWCGPKRPRFFSGRLLTADDFTEEQSYHREKHRRHVLALHGPGVVDGLRVTIGADGATLTIEPGLAIDPVGRELCIDQSIGVAVPVGTPSPAAVALYYAERPVDPLPTGTAQAMEPGRIEEGTRVAIAGTDDDGVTIAQIIWDGVAWRVDASFAPARTR